MGSSPTGVRPLSVSPVWEAAEEEDAGAGLGSFSCPQEEAAAASIIALRSMARIFLEWRFIMVSSLSGFCRFRRLRSPVPWPQCTMGGPRFSTGNF